MENFAETGALVTAVFEVNVFVLLYGDCIHAENSGNDKEWQFTFCNLRNTAFLFVVWCFRSLKFLAQLAFTFAAHLGLVFVHTKLGGIIILVGPVIYQSPALNKKRKGENQ